MEATPISDGECVLREALTVKEMTERVLANGVEPNDATEKLMRAYAASVRALLRGLHADPQELVGVIEKERDQTSVSLREVRWRWGRCPRCNADAWIFALNAERVACSRGRNSTMWDFLENQYQWEHEYATRFGEQHSLNSFDDRRRTIATNESST